MIIKSNFLQGDCSFFFIYDLMSAIMYLNKIILCIRNEGMKMVKNNIEVDVKVKCIESGKTQVQIAEEIGTTSQYVNRIAKKKDGVVNKTFVQMMESLGYDIEITYVKREG